jgi:Carboxypeptidase regulatory-like domain
MESSEVEQLVANREGRLCGRFYQRPDGTMLSQNCPVGFRAKVRRFSRVAGAALSAAMSAGLAAAQTIPQPSAPLVQIEGNESAVGVRVVDSEGAVIQNAEVSLLDQKSHKQTEMKTDATGKSTLSHLAPGSYVLKIHSRGFKIYSKNVTIKGAQSQNLEVTLEVGEMMMGVLVSTDQDVEPAIASLPNQIRP